MNTLPTRKDINPYGDLDGNSTEDKLFGKSLEDVVGMLEENSLYYQEMFMWMGAKAFIYYFPAALAYLSSNSSVEDSDFVNCMLGNIEFRLDHDQDEIEPAFPDIIRFVDEVLSTYSKFEIDESVYGDLESSYRVLRSRLEREQSTR